MLLLFLLQKHLHNMRITRQHMALNKRPALVLCIIFFLIALFIVESQINELKSSYKYIESQLLDQKRDRYAFQQNHLPMFNNLGSANDLNETIVVYNRVAKTGSTSFTNQVYDLAKQNHLYVMHVNTSKNSLKLSLFDQNKFVSNVTNWNRKPAFYHGHFAYIPFSQFGSKDAYYVNIIREPIDRMISHYYFLRYGDDYRKGVKRSMQGDTTTFDECVANQSRGCQARELWLQIPLLCGQAAECWKIGSQWALNQAKANVLTKYLLVGMTEQMEDFVVVLESAIPHMFAGLTKKFRTGMKSHIRKTLHKDPPSEEALKRLKDSKVYRMEKDLYEFVKKQFDYAKQLSTYTDENGLLQPMNQKHFRYEKIFGPKGRMEGE